VHPSNYRVVGFTSEVDARELAPLARHHGIPLIEDLGSGVLVSTDVYGLAKEPTVQSRITAGIDVVTFSGDKLLGGPQAGIIVGGKSFVEACRRHPLARALRVDKMTLAALQATLLDYLHHRHEHLPIYEMMGASVDTLRERAQGILDGVQGAGIAAGHLHVGIVETEATVGGGSLPGETVASVGLALQSKTLSAASLARRLRQFAPPIIGRVEGEQVLLDLRTVLSGEDELLATALTHIGGGGGSPNSP